MYEHVTHSIMGRIYNICTLHAWIHFYNDVGTTRLLFTFQVMAPFNNVSMDEVN
jgi:hypothetical protein